MSSENVEEHDAASSPPQPRPRRRPAAAPNSQALSHISQEMASVFEEYGVSMEEGIALASFPSNMLGAAAQGRRHSDVSFAHNEQTIRRHTIAAKLPTLGLRLPAKYARRKVQVDCLEPVIFEEYETDF